MVKSRDRHDQELELEKPWYEELRQINEELSKDDLEVVQVDHLVGPVIKAAQAGMHQHENDGSEPYVLVHEHEGGLEPHPHYEGQDLVYPVAGYSIPSGMEPSMREPSAVDRTEVGMFDSSSEGGVSVQPGPTETGVPVVYNQDEAGWEAMDKWIEAHQAEIRALAIERAREYGEQDFHFMAAVSAVMAGEGVRPETSKEEKVRLLKEMARYISGKLGRAAVALAKGELPSKDNWRDIEVYAFIAARFQEEGRWIGG